MQRCDASAKLEVAGKLFTRDCGFLLGKRDIERARKRAEDINASPESSNVRSANELISEQRVKYLLSYM